MKSFIALMECSSIRKVTKLCNKKDVKVCAIMKIEAMKQLFSVTSCKEDTKQHNNHAESRSAYKVLENIKMLHRSTTTFMVLFVRKCLISSMFLRVFCALS